MAITFEDFARDAIDFDIKAMPPMDNGGRHDGRKSDRKRGRMAKQETRARQQVRAIKHAAAA